MSKLFTPLKVGASQLEHRIAMAPMTRFRVEDDFVPMSAVKEYYEQRAVVPGTLLITEASVVSAANMGYQNVPGIWNQSQISAWRAVTDAVHAKGSVIFMQLWAHGRTGYPAVAESLGYKIVGPSAVPMAEGAPVPAEMTEQEIQQLIADYAVAARNAVIEAGFDGVEIHGANGYLPDQFLQDVSNKRTDAWGGSIENRARLHIELTKAVAAAVGADRTALRISPYNTFQGMLMADPDPTFRYLLEQLKPMGLAYLHAVESRPGMTDMGIVDNHDHDIDWLVELWDNASPFIVAGAHTPESARKTVDERFKGKDVIVAFGRPFIPNPDLVFRIQNGVELTEYDRSVFYAPKSLKGFADYPFSSEYQASVKAN